MPQQEQLIIADKIFTGETMLSSAALHIVDGVILNLYQDFDLEDDKFKNAERIEFRNGVLCAGFIDMQVNGGNGILFNDEPNVEGLKAIMAGHRKYGTTSMLPTLISDEFEVMQKAVDAVNQAISENVAGIKGIHLEGPYFNKNKKGVHQLKMIREVDDAAETLYKSLTDGVMMVTLAPEKVELDFIKRLTDAGVLVYGGHSEATYDETHKALKAGLSGFTHIYNAMPPLSSRAPGIVGAALEDENSYVGIIIDNIHVSKTSANIAIRAKKQGKVCLVTDAMPPVGAEDPSFMLYGEKITAKDGKCVNQEGTLAGSALNMADAVKNCHQILGINLEEAIKMATIYPAKALGLEKQVGLVVKGHQADLVHLDDDFIVTHTAIGGVWETHKE